MTKDTEALREAVVGNTAIEKIAILSNKDWPLARVDTDATLDMIHEIAVEAIYPTAPTALATPASDVAPVDVMIGNFIAQYDEGAAGCLLDVDDAQALAREFKRMQGLIYCPGVLRCAKCDFRLIKTTLCVSDGNAYANNEPDTCPNCNVPMWRITWQDEAHDAYKTAESQMDRALEAEKKLAHPPHPAPVDPAGGEALREALRRARDYLLEVGNDYPGSSCQKWCAEKATEIWNTLKPWEHCPSTHCERAQQCRSPNECSANTAALKGPAA